MSENKQNFIANAKITLITKYYYQEDSLFKLLYDKYLRKEFYTAILGKTAIIKNFNQIRWFKLSSIENVNADNLTDFEIQRNINGLRYFKYQMLIIKGQFYLYTLSFLGLIAGGLYLLPILNYKRKRQVQSIFLGLVITIIPYNVVLLYLVKTTHPLKKELEKSYLSEIAVYNKFYSKC